MIDYIKAATKNKKQKTKNLRAHARLQCISFSLLQCSEWHAQHAARCTQQERDLLLDGIFERIPLKFNLASCLLAVLRGRFFTACHLAPQTCLLLKDLSSAPFYKYENHFCVQEKWNSKSINICYIHAYSTYTCIYCMCLHVHMNYTYIHTHVCACMCMYVLLLMYIHVHIIYIYIYIRT